VIAQLAFPLHAPPQRTVVASSVARTTGPAANRAVQAVAPAPQSIPAGIDLIRPGPWTSTLIAPRALAEPASLAPPSPLGDPPVSGTSPRLPSSSSVVRSDTVQAAALERLSRTTSAWRARGNRAHCGGDPPSRCVGDMK
jgi:hypothetical protein